MTVVANPRRRRRPNLAGFNDRATRCTGSSSHGAIVARELGIPCVINTRVGTRALSDGDLVRVDGGNGVVWMLESAHRGPG